MCCTYIHFCFDYTYYPMYIHVVVDTTGHLNAFKSASVYDMFHNICESFAVNTFRYVCVVRRAETETTDYEN